MTKYCYDGGQVVTEYNGNDNLKLAYVYGAGIDEPVCFYNYSTWTTYYFHYDGLGNVIAISDDYQDIAERYEYDVYGGCIVHTDAGQDGQWMTADDTTDTESAAGNPYLFTGRRYDPETALYYYRARYYDYSTGRFLQPDPIGYEGGKSLFAYVGNNPVMRIDPFGLAWYHNRWIGRAIGAMGDATGFVHDIPGRVTGAVMGVDLTAQQVEEISSGFYEGQRVGATIAADEYTFGMIYPLHRAASEKVSEYGAAGEWSRTFAGISRYAAIAAIGAKGFEKTTGIRFEFHSTHGGRVPPHIQAIKGPGWGKTICRFPPH